MTDTFARTFTVASVRDENGLLVRTENKRMFVGDKQHLRDEVLRYVQQYWRKSSLKHGLTVHPTPTWVHDRPLRQVVRQHRRAGA